MELKELKQKLIYGDIKTAAGMLGISQKNGNKALDREGSKYHAHMVAILTKVVQMRELLTKEVQEEVVNHY